MGKYRIAVLASGEGSNFQALIDSIHRPGIARIVLLVSDNPQAGALERARLAGIPVLALAPQAKEGRRAFHARLAEHIGGVHPDLLVLAGYMRLLPREFIARFSPIINVHPSLLPAFPGLDAPDQAVARGVKLSGCTVHMVDAGMDTGPILMQVAVPVAPGDTGKSLHKRIKVQEHLALVRTVAAFAGGQVSQAAGNYVLEED